jgi:hypothetical protein
VGWPFFSFDWQRFEISLVFSDETTVFLAVSLLICDFNADH